MLGNLDTLQDAYATAENAAGSAAKEQENYSKSVQYSIDRAKASLQELAYDFLNSDLLKGIVDIGNSAINTIDEIVKHMGGIVPIITTIAGGILSGKNKFSFVEFTRGTSEAAADLKLFGISLTDVKTKFSEFYDTVKNKGFKDAFKGLFSKENMFSQSDIQNVQKFCDEIDNSGDKVVDFEERIKDLNPAVQDYVRNGLKAGKTGKEIAAGMQTATVSSKAATVAVKAFNVALSAIGGLVIGKIISAIVEGIDNLIHSTERAKEKLEESVDELESLKDELEDVNEELDNNKARIEELQSLGSLTYVEEQELQKLQAATEELEAQKKLKEWQIRNQQKEVANDALDLYEKEFKDDKLHRNKEISEERINSYANTVGQNEASLDYLIKSAEKNAQKNELYDNLAYYKRLTDVISEEEQKLKSMDPGSALYESTLNGIEKARSALDQYRIAISDSVGDFLDIKNDLQGEYDSIKEEHPDGIGLSSDEQEVVNTYDTIISQLEYMYDLMGLVNERGTGEGARDTAGVVQHFSERAGRAISLDEQQGIQGALTSLDQDQYNTAINFTDEQWKAVDASIQNVKQSTGEAVLSNEEYVRILTSAVEKANDVAVAEAKAATESKTLEDTLQSLGSSTDAFEAYVDTLKTLYPEFAHNNKAARDFALAQIAVDNAVADLSSNLDDYLYKLQNADRTSSDYATSINSLAADLSKLTGKEVSIYDAEQFASDARNIQLLKDALGGVEGAFDELKARFGAASGIIKITPGMDLSQFNADFDSFIDFINAHADLGELDVSAGLDTGDFYTVLQQVISSSEQAAEAVKSYFNQLGWDMKFDWDSIDIPVPHAAAGPKGGTQSAYNEARAEQNSLGFVNAQMKIPTNFRLVSKNGTSITPPSSGGGGSSSGGSGGGGSSSGGGGGSSPVNDAADAVTDAAEVVEDAAQSAAEAAMEAFNEIKGIWDKWISDQQHNHQMTGYRKELADLQGKSLNDSSIPYGNYWKLTLAELDGLAFSYNGMANSLTAQMNQALATGAIQAGSQEHNEMQASIQQAYQSQFQAMVEYQELLAKREEDRTSIIERIADRFGKIVENLGKNVSRMWSWWNKNWAVNKQIAAVEKEREKQENVEKRYNKDLKRIGLESKYARAIKNDTLNVNKIQDGFVLERIQKYQDLYDKIRECQEAQKELYEQERELIKSKLSNIVEYFDDIQKYYDSVTGKLDSLKTVKDAAGQKQSLTDILDQYAARTDSYNNAAKAQWTYQTGIDENNTRSMGEIQKDLAVDEIYDSEYYQSIKERNDKLKQQESDYQDKLEEIAELREELANATSKKEKSRIKKEIKTAKKEAKTLKLTSGQKKTLKSTDQTLTGAQYVTGAAGMEDTYASAMYQQLLKQIGQLESKKKLSKKEQKTLQMYHDELDALNEGVLVGNVATFRTKFEQLWKLDHSGKALTKAQEQTKAALEKSLDNIKQGYLDYISALDKELSDRMVLDGQSEADLEANYKKTREDTEKSFDEEMKDLTDQSGTATVKNLQANIDKWNDWLSKGKNSKGKKLTSKQKKELENKILAAQAKLEKLAQVPVENVARASSIYDWLEKNRSKYDNNKLSKKDREKWDRLTAELNGYITKQNDAVEELEKERADALEELDNNYETQLNELEEQKNQRLAETYEWAKQAAEYAIETANSTIEMLSEYINQYKSVVELLKDVDLNTLKKYGITDLLGLDGNSDVTDLLRDQLLGGIDAASRKVQESVKKGELLKKLINAGYGGDFEEVLLANSAGLDSSYIQTLRDIAAQLVEGGYSHESWIEEWEKQLADLTGDLVSTTKEVQDFKDQLREDVLFKATDNALASVNRLKNQLSSMQSIIRDDWTTDVNGMTTYGAAKVNEYAQSWKAAQDAVGLYAQRLREIDAAQANPEEYGYASEQDWLNARNEAIQNYYTAVQEGESAAQAIYEIGKKAREQEINDLKRLVDARKDALKSKKEYYEYDKQHKAAQKSVDEIKAQVEALNNVSDAASKAKKQQLLSDLKDAEDALQDLETEHRFDLSDKALDDFINDLEDTLNNANATIKDTFEEFTKIVEETIEAAKGVNTQWESDRLVSYFGLGDKTKILSDSSMVNPTSLIGENGSIYTPITAEEFTSGLSTIKVDLTAVETYLSRINNDAEKMVATLATMSPDLRTIVEGLDYSLDLSMNWENLVNVEGSLDAVSTERLMKEMATIPSMITQKIYQMISKAGLKKKYR